MLRVLVVLPFYGGSLPIGRFAAEALQETGCLVEVFDSPAFFPAFAALKELKVASGDLDSLQDGFVQWIFQSVQAKITAFAPDLVLAMAQAPLSRFALRSLRKQGIPTAMWFVEDFRLFTYWRSFAPFYDIFAVIQKDPFIEELAAAGQHNVLYLPLAAQPSFHRPLELGPTERKEFGAQLSFLGAGYLNRRKAFVELGKEYPDLKIWGNEWEDEPGLTAFVQRGGQRISPEDAVRIFNATAINLNLHSSVQADALVSGGDFVNPRTFEIAACGGFQLVDKRGLMPELFADDDLALFESMDQLREKILWFKDRPEERNAYAERARQRVLKEHTYAQRMRDLLVFAKQRLPGFGVRQDVSWPSDMPEELRQAVTGLLAELDLPPTVSFDDLMTAVRNKNERLSDLETALLFLDEWKKLYTK